MADRLIIKGAREHNLKGVDLDLPRDKMIVFTGLSGSGKSSLAFDTIFAEGQRRYVESLSAYARQFLGQMDKPDVDFIEGLSPAVSIDQKSTNRNPRSTVGTITEVYDYLRLLYARAGVAHCPKCDAEISSQSPQQIVDDVLSGEEGRRFMVLAPVVRTRKGEFVELFADLASQGFNRIIVDGEQYQLSNPPTLEKQIKHDIDVVVDRLTIKDSQKQRLTDSVETALRLTDGLVIIDYLGETVRYSEHMACPNGHKLSIDELEPRSFSFNSPYGACPTCDGLGVSFEVDVDLVIPDKDAPVESAFAPWNTTNKYYKKLLAALAAARGFDVTAPYSSLGAEDKAALLFGSPDILKVRYRNRFGSLRTHESQFEGVINYVNRRLSSEEVSEAARERFQNYLREIPCPSCNGTRLKPEILAVRIDGQLSHSPQSFSIADVTSLSVADAAEFLGSLTLSNRQALIAGAVLKEIQARLKFLLDVGLNYLTLNRAAGTLSGGEAQRIRLATQIGSGLAGVLYVLDEPSIGLHQRDNQRLITTLENLRDLGNTLIVVEHDEDTIRAADWLVDVGPRAGEYGGEIVYQGQPQGILTATNSLTGKYLSGELSLPIPKRRKTDKDRQLKIVGAKENNLKDVSVKIPLGVLTCVTGVSGSGKSTLVNQILAKSLQNNLNGARQVPGRHTRIEGLEHLDKLVQVDQSPIGRTPRSNPATYTGVFDKIRNLFAETPEAKARGYKAGRFSFNVKGGRCEACSGDGTLKIEMNFLPDVYVPCEVCNGARYNRETLEVKYHGKNISEVLDMPISEAAEFFGPITAISRYLQTLVDVGLGYVRLGQSATTLSGGEAQRVKLAAELQKRSNGRTIYILDEPTTGLHFEDIRRLMLVIEGLVEKGNTVLVIEHNLDVIKAADWIIDMGPEGGSGGGTVVAQGTPEKVAKVAESHTGHFLKEILKG
ncbi:MAG: excinuclease ABC subunit UvrA [Corynebacterium sp.]|nr:excinuclease ABC subunit UvrA [Corynebacterium sp.]